MKPQCTQYSCQEEMCPESICVSIDSKFVYFSILCIYLHLDCVSNIALIQPILTISLFTSTLVPTVESQLKDGARHAQLLNYSLCAVLIWCHRTTIVSVTQRLLYLNLFTFYHCRHEGLEPLSQLYWACGQIHPGRKPVTFIPTYLSSNVHLFGHWDGRRREC